MFCYFNEESFYVTFSILILCTLFAITRSSNSVALECEFDSKYVFTHGAYKTLKEFNLCLIDSQNIEDESTEYTIKPSLSPENVTGLFFYNCNVTFVPNIIFETFHNVELLTIDGIGHGLRSLKQHHFKGASNLKYFRSFNNEMKELKADVFKNSPNLETILLTDGTITTVDVHAFRGLSHLTDVYLDNNHVYSVEPQMLTELKSLRVLKLTEIANEDDYYQMKDESLEATEILKRSKRDLYPVNLEDNNYYEEYEYDDDSTSESATSLEATTVESDDLVELVYRSDSSDGDSELIEVTTPSSLTEQELISLTNEIKDLKSAINEIEVLIEQKAFKNNKEDFKKEIDANNIEIKEMVKMMLGELKSKVEILETRNTVAELSQQKIGSRMSEDSDESNESSESGELEDMKKLIDGLIDQMADILQKNVEENGVALEDLIIIVIGGAILIVLLILVICVCVGATKKNNQKRKAPKFARQV